MAIIPAIGKVVQAVGTGVKIAGAPKKVVGVLKAKVGGGLTKGSSKLLQKIGFSDDFIQGFNNTIEGITRVSQGDLMGMLKSYTANQKALERYAKVVGEYNELIDKEAVNRFLRGERVDDLVRIVSDPPLDTRSILEEVKRFNYRKRSLKTGGSNKTLQAYIDSMRSQNYSEVADYLEYLKESTGKTREYLNELVRTGDLQEALSELYSNGEWVIDSEDNIIDQLEQMFTDENIQEFYSVRRENAKLAKQLSAKKRAQIVGQVRERTPQQIAKAKSVRGKRKSK